MDLRESWQMWLANQSMWSIITDGMTRSQRPKSKYFSKHHKTYHASKSSEKIYPMSHMHTLACEGP